MNAPIAQEHPIALTSASAGTLLMDNMAMDRLERVADLMASGKTTVPQHLRGSKGDCFAITLQSMQWGMNPFSVAQKTHLVNGTLGYEAQLVAAVINSSGIVKDRFQFEWFGTWEKIIGRFKEVESKTKKDDNGYPKKYIVPAWEQKDEQGLGVKVWATLKGEDRPRELTLLLTQARVRNSTLWTEDPKQQLAYLAQKRWSRLYTPDVILGVYTPEELQEPSEKFMGMVEEAPAGTTPAGKAELTEWPDDALEKRFPKYLQALADGHTHDQIIASAEAKGKLTDAQKARIRELKPVQPQAQQAGKAEPDISDATPKVTYAEVASKLHAAKTSDELDDAGTLIGAVSDPEQRKELTAIFEQRTSALKGA